MPRQCETYDEHHEDDKDLTGQRFGAWTAIEMTHLKDGKYDKILDKHRGRTAKFLSDISK